MVVLLKPMQWMVNARWRFRVRAIYYSWRPGIKTCCSNGGETCGLHSPHLGCGATDTHQHLSQPLFILVGYAGWLWLACFLHSAVTVNTRFIIWLYLCRGRGKGGDHTWFSLVCYKCQYLSDCKWILRYPKLDLGSICCLTFEQALLLYLLLYKMKLY